MSEATAVERFWRFVDKTESCWLWTGNKLKDGYGRHHVGKKKYVKAHRFSFELHNGAIPDGLRVCHKCDIKNCVNPAHLWLGTDADNLADRDRKGRHFHGERVNTAKITESQVLEIRAKYKSARKKFGMFSKLGREYGISNVTARAICLNLIWKHLL